MRSGLRLLIAAALVAGCGTPAAPARDDQPSVIAAQVADEEVTLNVLELI